MESQENLFVFVEKYRPQKVQDCILSESIKKVFLGFLEHKDFPNLLLSGPPGVGKTTVARALCQELNCDLITINGSDEGRFLDTIRYGVRKFASSNSFDNSQLKVVLIDEADNTTHDVQCLLRAFIEEFSDRCRFIFTCNFVNRIIEAIHSRTSVVDFSPIKEDSVFIKKQFLKLLFQILFLENIKYDKKIVAEYIKCYYPDWRRLLNEIQRNSSTGTLLKLNSNISNIGFSEIVHSFKEKDFNSIREWYSGCSHIEQYALLKEMYKNFKKLQEENPIEIFPDIIIIIAKYMEMASKVADPEINILSCCAEIMLAWDDK